MDYNVILTDAERWVKAYMADQQGHGYCFHDLAHTQDVVEAVAMMADHYHLPARDRFIVLIAAYFHDLGYFSGGPAEHEQRGAELAADFLASYQVEATIIEAVKACIYATRLPQNPKNLLEEIVSDADLFHLGGDNFRERNDLMRRERGGNECLEQDWRNQTLALLENHKYHTDYAKQRLNDKKQKNIDFLKQQQTEEALPMPETETIKEETKKKKKERNNRPDRGIETMFRVTSTNNQRLSDMADNKANILLTVNSIILSVVIALLVRKLEDAEHLAAPTFVLLLVSLSTIVVAILATRPKIPGGTFSQEDVDKKAVNLLFFGNFYKMGLDQYAESMRKVMDDRDFLYGTLTRDVYSQGVVLGRKYRLLRLAYNIFMYGMIFSVLTFLLASIVHDAADIYWMTR
ncbi:Pycsar system effector family protein [Parapedobacter koreensis]|uniref:Predicted metal-dependent phosphohydrolase, HD superfamily n=1 Tax=Parapedobacter koreensis TaxID=332977 RepID=A0A1H7F667_9SPHI|nr:Pycsar system effector family protein [Parapedobacter koreensis]SEK21579.1 Predicted metal-dependent phosphohydrolase, HD superfamily [Parapedobacter koreensis]